MLPVDSLCWEAFSRWRNCHLINKTLIMKYISHKCGLLTMVVLWYHETWGFLISSKLWSLILQFSEQDQRRFTQTGFSQGFLWFPSSGACCWGLCPEFKLCPCPARADSVRPCLFSSGLCYIHIPSLEFSLRISLSLGLCERFGTCKVWSGGESMLQPRHKAQEEFTPHLPWWCHPVTTSVDFCCFTQLQLYFKQDLGCVLWHCSILFF